VKLITHHHLVLRLAIVDLYLHLHIRLSSRHCAYTVFRSKYSQYAVLNQPQCVVLSAIRRYILRVTDAPAVLPPVASSHCQVVLAPRYSDTWVTLVATSAADT
jgi:hypothetical protein